MKKLALLSVLAFFCANLQAQSLFEGEYILFGLGGQMENFKDDLVSPLKYRGYSGAAAIGWHSQHGAWQNNLDGHIAIGLQSPAALNDASNQTTTISGSINYNLRYRIINREKQALFLGLCSANLIGFRQHNLYRNSSLSFSNFISYGLSASWQYQPQLKIWNVKIPFAWQTEFNFPLASYLIMPGYNRQFFNDKAGLRKHSFIGDFWHLEFLHNLVYPLSNGNQVRLSYHWNYAEYNGLNYLAQAQHYLMFHLLFKL
jgi:hypothetical protein